ncbi:MAG: transaldolase, partial [Oscillospiraceae bacterium]|nr:transaldolase [Oscillospiraceae bacterium]
MLRYTLSSLGLPAARGDEELVARVWDMTLTPAEFSALSERGEAVGASERFKDVLKTFPVESGTPAGFRRELQLKADGLIEADLVRDISYDKNGEKRPTAVLFSADSANPYEVEPISPLLANLTCNPGIVYDLFLNNPKANVGNVYKDRDELKAEIGRNLGPRCD